MTWSGLEQAVRDWISHPVQRPFNASIEAEPDDTTIAAGKAFVPEASYFSVRLVEMSLAEGGRYFVEFLPLGVCLAEYTIGDQRQRTPMILSNELIAGQIKGKAADAGYVEYVNMYAVRRAPVKADNLSLFVGLFRMPYQDLAKQALQIAADVTEQTGIGASVATGLRIAEKVYDRVAGLFKLDVVEPRFGFADGNALTESGYLLVAGPSATAFSPERFKVIGGKLFLDGKRAAGFDYCLVALEYTETLLPQGDATINPLTGLAFHKRWRGIAQLLANKRVAEAEAEMPQLRAEVTISPELTEDDRLYAIAAYDTSYEKFRAKLAPAAGAADQTRAGRSDAPAIGLLLEAGVRKDAQPEVGLVLAQMATRLQIATPAPAPPSTPADEADLLFAAEATALRKALPRIAQNAAPNLAANVAEAIGSALTRRATSVPFQKFLGKS